MRVHDITVYTCHNKLCVSIPTLVPDPSTHFVWDEFAVGICHLFAIIIRHSPYLPRIRHFHITYDASCLIPPALPPPQKKKERKKENNLHKNYSPLSQRP